MRFHGRAIGFGELSDILGDAAALERAPAGTDRVTWIGHRSGWTSELLMVDPYVMYPNVCERTLCSGLLPALVALGLAGCSAPSDGEQTRADAEAGHRDSSGHAHAAASAQPANDDDLGWSKLQNGHEHHTSPPPPWEALPADVRARLTHQLALTRSLIAKYPTVAAAEAAGYRRAGGFVPGMGVHYMGGGLGNASGTLSDEEILRPSNLIFDGTDKNSRIAGFMYVSHFLQGKGQVEGFAGPYDAWHSHSGFCFKTGADGGADILGGDGNMDEEQCRKAGGTYRVSANFMVHVWTVPGYKSTKGVFSPLNPAMKCPDGTYYSEGPARMCRGT